MKRTTILKQLRQHGCVLKREGRSHSLWINLLTGEVQAIPRHVEIPERLAHSILDKLSVPRSDRYPVPPGGLILRVRTLVLIA